MVGVVLEGWAEAAMRAEYWCQECRGRVALERSCAHECLERFIAGVGQREVQEHGIEIDSIRVWLDRQWARYVMSLQPVVGVGLTTDWDEIELRDAGDRREVLVKKRIDGAFRDLLGRKVK